MKKVFISVPAAERIVLSPEDSRHIMQVLRHTIGDCLLVTDSCGNTYEAEITAWEDKVVTLRRGALKEQKQDTGQELILAIGLLKSDKLEWVLQKTAELGIAGVIPLQMQHCVVKMEAKKWPERKKRWERIQTEAAKQCGRSEIPWLSDCLTLPQLLEAYADWEYIVPYEREEEGSLRAACQKENKKTILVIGPEGGFSKEEIAQIQAAGGPRVSLVSLGPRILRAETAAVSAAAIVMYERGFR